MRILVVLVVAVLFVCFLPAGQVLVQNFESTPDPAVWSGAVVRGNGSFQVTNKRLELSISPGSPMSSVRYSPRFFAGGDFDIQVDYSLLNWPTTQPNYLSACIRMDPVGRPVEMGRSFNLHNFDYVSSTAATGTSGRVRLTRVGSNWSGYYWGSGQWWLLTTFTGATKDVWITFEFYGEATAASVALDNISISAERLVEPQVLTFAQFADGGGIISEVLLSNVSQSHEMVNVSFRGDQGQPIELSTKGMPTQLVSLEVYPGGVDRLLTDGVGNVKVGSVEVRSLVNSSADSKLAASLIFNLNGQTSVPPPVASDAQNVFVENNAKYNSGVALANPGAVEITILLRLLGIGGAQIDSRPATLAAHGHLAQFLTELFPNCPDDFMGSVQATSSQPFVLLGMRQDRVTGNLGLLCSAPGAFE